MWRRLGERHDASTVFAGGDSGMSACRAPMVASPIGATRGRYQRKQASGGGLAPWMGTGFRPSSARSRYGAQRRCDATNGKRGGCRRRPARRPSETPGAATRSDSQGLFSRAISISCPCPMSRREPPVPMPAMMPFCRTGGPPILMPSRRTYDRMPSAQVPPRLSHSPDRDRSGRRHLVLPGAELFRSFCPKGRARGGGGRSCTGGGQSVCCWPGWGQWRRSDVEPTG